MKTLIGKFLYPGIEIVWTREHEIDTVSEQRELDKEELCKEHLQPIVFATNDCVEARIIFTSWVNNFVSALVPKAVRNLQLDL
jgi:hypothetical protein